MNTFRLDNKVALITGASKGIGESIAVAFASQGAKVVINSRKQEELDKVVTQIKSLGGDCTAMAMNVGDDKACQALMEATCSNLGSTSPSLRATWQVTSLYRKFSL